MAVPAGSPRSQVFRRALDYAISNGQTPGPIQGDRGYTDLDLTEVEGPIHDAGFQLIKDLKKHQRNQTGPTRKALYRDGFFFTTGTPKSMLIIKGPSLNDTTAQRLAKYARFDERAAYAFQIHSETETTIRFRGPSTFDAVRDHNESLVSYRKDRLTARCPHPRNHQSRHRPTPGTTRPGTEPTHRPTAGPTPGRGSVMSPHPNQVTANQHGGQPPLPENS